MPVHTLAEYLGDISTSHLVVGAGVFALLFWIKIWSGGRSTTWEREWAGKMILVVASPTPTIMTLLDHLLHLPSPPQILFLPPVPSPLPESLLTVLHTIRLSASTNPLAQLHCEPLPPTPLAVRDFTKKWASAPTNITGEGGRRIDAIVLGSGWEVRPYHIRQEGEWSTHQFHFHLLTSLLPHLLRSPAERSIRIISLISPTWSAALPSLTGAKARDDVVFHTGRRSLNTLLLMKHFQLILDTLASATFGKVTPVPGAEDEGVKKKRDKSLKSNIMSISVVMGWAREEVVRGWILLYPLVMFVTPSPKKSIQSILFALSAPVRYDELDETPKVVDQGKETLDKRRTAVGGGDAVRDCAVVDLPPVLSNPGLAKAMYDELEKEVEAGVKKTAEGEKLRPQR
ncbi:hypothetical protein IAR55_006581 [Kwoniella newhampshirensis]|uniref:Uncharacterized protein n=1 Tax=Kwoniella newhampshirensis TaxID=1651941 RepID=A0AAW0YEE6_9TREE